MNLSTPLPHLRLLFLSRFSPRHLRNLRLRFPRLFRLPRLLLLCCAPLLCSTLLLCGCGGGGSGVTDEADPFSLLPAGNHLVPEYFVGTCLHITGSSTGDGAAANVDIQLNCLRAKLSGESASGDLGTANPASYVKVDYTDITMADEDFSLQGRWEQCAANSPNLIPELLICRAENRDQELVKKLSIEILTRQDDPTATDATIILQGRVSSGTLILKNNGTTTHLPLSGTAVTLTYTIAPGYINDQTHNTPTSETPDEP